MSKIRFTKKEIDKLSKNKYVLNVSDKPITYTNTNHGLSTFL